jgi:hypothetical protein
MVYEVAPLAMFLQLDVFATRCSCNSMFLQLKVFANWEAPQQMLVDKTGAAIGHALNELDTNFSAAPLRHAIPPAAFFPPDGWIFRPIQHLRQFFLDLCQAVGTHLHCRLVDLAVRPLAHKPGIHVPQIRDFLT